MQTVSKRWSLSMVTFFLMTAAAFAGVSVSSPSSGSTNSSPVHFVASATGASAITAMRIYVDSQSVYAVSAGSLNTSLSMGSGSHSISVQAWDTHGDVYKQQFTITVSSGGGGGVPSGATTRSEIQNMSGWQNCTVCAGIGGSGPSAPVSMVQFQKSPSLSGSSAKFTIGGKTPYADSLWWEELGAANSAANFQYDADFYLTDPQVSQALEFDVTQYVLDQKFILGIQCDFKDHKVWDVFSTSANQWESTGVACTPPTAFTWHHITYQSHRSSSQTTVVSITLDGVTHYVNKTFGTKPVSGSGISVSFQMDLDNLATQYSAWVDNLTLRYW